MKPAFARSLVPSLQALVTPSVFDFWARHLNPTLAWSRTLATVVERRQETANTFTLVLQPNRNFRGFAPGQHVNVTAEIAGVNVTRSYSLSDIPRADGRIAITVQQVEGGRLSIHLCTRTRVGEVLELGAAYGELTWPQVPAQPWLLLAAGSGITPLMSLLRSAAASANPKDLVLLYWARSAAELCFVQELQQLSAQNRGIRCEFIFTRDTGSVLQGRPCAEQFAQLVPDLASRRVYACGPGGFVDSVRSLAASTAASFAAEAFTPPALPANNALGTVRVSLTQSGKTLEVAAGSSLLEALEAQGLNPTHGCRMGICNTCVCTKQSGTTEHLLSGERDTGMSPALKICVSRACDDLVLDL